MRLKENDQKTHIFPQEVKAQLTKVKDALDKRNKEFMVKVEELKNAEAEIDDLKRLLNVARDMRRKSVAQMKLSDEQLAEQDEEEAVPEGCKTQ